MKKVAKLLTSALLFSVASTSYASTSYMTAGIGQSSIGVAPQIQNGGMAFDVGYGVRESLNFAIEGGVIGFNSKSLTGSNKTTGQAYGGYLDAVGVLPFEDYVDVNFPLEFTARAGLGYVVSSGNLATGNSTSASKMGLTFGFGAQYSVTSKTAIRLQWDSVKLGYNPGYAGQPKSRESIVTIGVNYSF